MTVDEISDSSNTIAYTNMQHNKDERKGVASRGMPTPV